MKETTPENCRNELIGHIDDNLTGNRVLGLVLFKIEFDSIRMRLPNSAAKFRRNNSGSRY